MRRLALTTSVIALTIMTPGCAALSSRATPVLDTGWSREELRTRGLVFSCEPDDCMRTWRTPRGPLRLETRAKTYGLHQIPGWNVESTTSRVVGGILGGLLRRQGLTTEYVEVGAGTRTVIDSGDTRWELRCSVYWIDDLEEEYSKDEDDHTVNSTRRSEGASCTAADRSNPAIVLWRFRAGIAPPRDSLAAIYDSIGAVNPAMVSATPPMSLQRMRPDGSVDARYALAPYLAPTLMNARTVIGRIQVSRDSGGSPIAMIHARPILALDIAPEATADETRILRLLTALMAASFEGTGG